MHRFAVLAILACVCFAGCAKEYQPPPESIPDIKPGRGSPGAEGGPASGGAALTPPK